MIGPFSTMILPQTPSPIRARAPLTPMQLAFGLLLFAVVWLGTLALTCTSPPSDNVEQLTWVRSLEWGYYKHPPLPTWLLWLPVQVFGPSASVTYVMGAVTVLVALAVLWRLLSTLRGAAYADIALLCTLCMGYYNRHLFYYNHNVVLMLLSISSAALLWKAHTTRRLRWWIALGAAIGMGALAKYQMAVTVLSALAFLLHQRAWRDPAHRLGLLMAAVVALLIFAPHIAWLRSHHYGPIGYAVETSLGARLGAVTRVQVALHWVVGQLLVRGGPALALLAAVAWQLKKAHATRPTTWTPRDEPHRDPARALIVAWGVLPLVFMPLVGIALGSHIKGHWGTAFVAFALPAVMELAPRGYWDSARWTQALPGFLLIQVLLLLLEYANTLHDPGTYSKHDRNHFDAPAYARTIAGPARAQLGGPIRVISGPANPASLLSEELPEKPLVLVDGRLDRSPWIAPDLVTRCGAVELGFTEPAALANPAGTTQARDPDVPYAHVRIDATGARLIGPLMPGLSWRVRLPQPGAAPCDVR